MILFKYAELEQAAALKYLYGWLRHHPKYGTIAPPELADSLYYADVGVIFVITLAIVFHLAHFVICSSYNTSKLVKYQISWKRILGKTSHE